jgi:hypothetical protein
MDRVERLRDLPLKDKGGTAGCVHTHRGQLDDFLAGKPLFTVENTYQKACFRA